MVLNLVVEDVVIAATSTLLTTDNFDDVTSTITITKTVTSTYTSYLPTFTSVISAVTTTSYGIVGELTKRETPKFDNRLIAAIVLPIAITFIISIAMIISWYFRRLKNNEKIEKIDEKDIKNTKSNLTFSVNDRDNFNNRRENNSNIYNYITKQPPETPLAIGLPFPSSATSFSTFTYDALSQFHNDNSISSPKIGKFVQPRAYPQVINLVSSQEIDKKKTTVVNKI